VTDTAAPALPGISLRDYFAGQALTALLPQAVRAQEDAVLRPDAAAGATIDLAAPGVRWACVRAYNVADAMVHFGQTVCAQPAAAPGVVLPGPGSNGHAHTS